MTLCKRIIPCLDVDSNGRTVKGIQFQGLRDMGDPVAMADVYQQQGADELVFLDISASHEGRNTMLSVAEQVARVLMIPFTVGGGISSLDHVKALLAAGADKVSVNSSAVQNPALIGQIAQHCGSQCCVLAIDARKGAEGRDTPGLELSGYDVLTHGGRKTSGKDVLAWAQEAVALGAGEILLTSWDQDGTRAGFDLPLTRLLSQALPVPVIASGGASGPQSFIDVFGPAGCADAALAASIFHEGQWTVHQLKTQLAQAGICVRQS
ncbi:MAG: imidazole glycerol phosphate synthase subunit HisF [Vampirovibrionales bacterium]|nr:imidazole glycerol phosphate synthase subunit HisF [Vampirovibrionales bacterium]